MLGKVLRVIAPLVGGAALLTVGTYLPTTLFVVSNCLLAAGAAAANIWAFNMLKGDDGRYTYFGIGLLAAVYSGAYMWLYANPRLVGEWSETLRPLAFVVWPLVWAWPAIAKVRDYQKAAARIERKADEILVETLPDAQGDETWR